MTERILTTINGKSYVVDTQRQQFRSEDNSDEIISFQSLAEEALDAFWEVIGRKLPDVTTGDLSPLTTFQMENAAETAVSEWIANNCN